MRWICRHWPALAALAVLYVVLAGCLAVSLHSGDGHFTYALDDPYIHMASAKNLAEHGVAGVTRYSYSASSSSIAWPLLLTAVYWTVGTNAVAPLVLNVICATALVAVVYVLLRRHGVSGWSNFGGLLIIGCCTPLPAIIFTGLEHTLHVVLAVAFLYLAAISISQQSDRPRNLSGGMRALYFALAPLITMTRYEGALMIAVVCLLLAARRRLREATVLGFAGAAPVVVSGLVSMAAGWHFLPNPVLLKGHAPQGSSWDQILQWFRSTATVLVLDVHLSVLIATAAAVLILLWRTEGRRWTTPKTMLLIFLGTAVLHVQLAKTGWFFRYEAYLMACGLLALFAAAGRSLAEYLKSASGLRRAVVCCAACVLLLPPMARGVDSLGRIPRATARVYRQQYQMALFVDTYYHGQAVAANDIGAINYYADIRNLDLWGLGSMEVADARLRNRYGPEVVRTISADHDVKMAMVFDNWFERYYEGLPSEWQRVGQWEITAASGKQNVVVSFYAVDPVEKESLVRHLWEFSSRLPEQVVQRGLYIEAHRGRPRFASQGVSYNSR